MRGKFIGVGSGTLLIMNGRMPTMENPTCHDFIINRVPRAPYE
jgi:hypothetical protein